MAGGRVSDGSLVLAAPVSLTGRYARQGRMAAAGLQQAVDDVANSGGILVAGRAVIPEIALLDDEGTRSGVRHALDLAASADLILSPYGSDLVAEAAVWAQGRGRVVWNHGASADEVQRMPGVVSVPSPTSRYLAVVLESLAAQMPRARVLVAVSGGSFGMAAADGATEAAGRLGMQLIAVAGHRDVEDCPDTDVLLVAGGFEDDIALVRRIRRRPAVLATVAGALAAFGDELDPQGVLAPSQWEEGARFHPDVGARAADVTRSLRARTMPNLRTGSGFSEVDYPAAQAYAAVLVALRCAEGAAAVDDPTLSTAAARLRCTTFFGRFGLADDGRQHDHDMLVVRWREGAKIIVWPPSLAQAPAVSG